MGGGLINVKHFPIISTSFFGNYSLGFRFVCLTYTFNLIRPLKENSQSFWFCGWWQADLDRLHFAILSFFFFTDWRLVLTLQSSIDWHHFSNSIWSLCVSVSHISSTYFKPSLLAKGLPRLRWWLAFFSNKVFFN